MRSTITRYFAGSSMRVPPSFTNSAVTPSFAPKVFTRSMNAGGKLNSRPHNRPTFFIAFTPQQDLRIFATGWRFKLRINSRNQNQTTVSDLIYSAGCRRRLDHSAASFIDQMLDHRFKVAGLLIHAQLPLGAGSFVHNSV